MINKYVVTMLVLTTVSAVVTYFINNELGLGPFLANGSIGVLAALLFSKGFAAAIYTASFVGMSADFVLPTLTTAVVAGLVVGVVILATKPILAGWGGKGGTTAALAVLLTLALLNLPFNM